MRTLCLIITGLFLSFICQAQVAPDRVPGRLIVHHNGNPADLGVARAFASHRATVHRRLDKLGVTVIDVQPGTEDAVLQSLSRNPLFGEVEFDHYAKPASVPNDPDLSSQWYLTKIQAFSAWNITTGASFPIAVIDSGVDPSHPDLSSRLMTGWNFVAGNSNTADTTGHGTAVAGVFGALANNGIGVAGITWQNPILPLLVVDSNNYAAYSNIAAAIQYAADHGARVISISLGGTASSSVLQSAVNYAWNAGAIVVAAAMNNSNSTPNYPAACTNAIAVSATDENDNLATFSNFGSWITLSAPGNNIETTNSGGGYGEWWGTSLATPVVSGVAALALAANPSLTPQALVTLLEQNSDDLGPAGYDTSFGWGRVNAYKAVLAALGQPVSVSPPPTPTPPPTPVPSTLPILIHSGGGSYTDSSGRVWSADAGYSGGTSYSTSYAIANTSVPALYQTCRYGNFTYSFQVPNGSYNVTLKFAELSLFGAGQRVFNVAINGAAVLTNFDIYAQAGGALIALDRSFPVIVTGGTLSIQFSSGPANLPLVNSIDIEQSVAATASGVVRVNAGGGAYSISGQSWAADTGYSGGSVYSTSANVANTPTPALYQTCRYGNFSYNLSVPNGSYTVTLKFAEVARTGPGQRVFNVAINGSQVLTNFDVFAQSGGAFIALDKTFPVTVSNGQVTLQFTNGPSDLPLLNAIDIEPGSIPPVSSSVAASVLVNSGAGAYIDASGQTWSADTGYSGGSSWSTSSNVGNTGSPALYQTCRYGVFGYTFSVPAGNYNVTLKFAEIAMWAPGQRQFNVAINGSYVLSNFDIFAQAGGEFIAMDKTFPVTASGGQISIQFTAGAANLPMVNAISIVSTP